MKKSASKTNGGGGGRAAAISAAVYMDSTAKNYSALSGAVLAEFDLFAGDTEDEATPAQMKMREDQKKRRLALVKKRNDEKRLLRDHWESLGDQLRRLEDLATMSMAQRAARMREIATPSQRRAAAVERVEMAQAASRERFEQARQSEGANFAGDLSHITLKEKIEHQKRMRPRLIQAETKRLETELAWLRKYDGKDKKKVAKDVNKTKDKLAEARGKLIGPPLGLGDIATRQEFAEDLADEVAAELADKWEKALEKSHLSKQKQGAERRRVYKEIRSVLYPVGNGLRRWPDFSKLLCALRAMREMVKEPDETRRHHALTVLFRDWPGCNGIVKLSQWPDEGRNHQWEADRQPMAETALVEFLWRLPLHYSREAQEEREREYDEMERIGALFVQWKHWDEIADEIDRVNIRRRIFRNFWDSQEKLGIGEATIRQNFAERVASGDIQRQVDKERKNSPVTGITIRDRYRAYCKRHGVPLTRPPLD
jgi:hypothetical protein